jgi:ArsR family metal-binding transcriptional regulator
VAVGIAGRGRVRVLAGLDTNEAGVISYKICELASRAEYIRHPRIISYRHWHRWRR